MRRFERGTTSDTTRAARRLAIREQAITGVRPQDVDLGRRHVTVFGKGQKSRVIPLRGRIVLEIERYLLDPLPFLGRVPEPDDFVLYPEKRTAGGRILAAYPEAADE